VQKPTPKAALSNEEADRAWNPRPLSDTSLKLVRATHDPYGEPIDEREHDTQPKAARPS
jgi:hypothetical protein